MSKWINESPSKRGRFAWQEGYGAFTISVSQIDPTLAYFARQEEHHAKRTFRDEVEEMLRSMG